MDKRRYDGFGPRERMMDECVDGQTDMRRGNRAIELGRRGSSLGRREMKERNEKNEDEKK